MKPRVSLFLTAVLAVSCTPRAERDTASANAASGFKVVPEKEDKAGKPPKRKPLPRSQRGETTSISLERFFPLQQSGNVYIIDARPTFFYKLGHIPGAVSMPAHMGADSYIDAYEAPIKAAIKAGKPIVVYCTSLTCRDARTFANHLSLRGYSSSVFQGGWHTWKEAGLPTE